MSDLTPGLAMLKQALDGLNGSLRSIQTALATPRPPDPSSKTTVDLLNTLIKHVTQLIDDTNRAEQGYTDVQKQLAEIKVLIARGHHQPPLKA